MPKEFSTEVKHGKLAARYYPLKRHWLIYGIEGIAKPVRIKNKQLYQVMNLMVHVVEADDRAQIEADKLAALEAGRGSVVDTFER